MGWLFLQAYNEKDTPIVEEIAKLHKVDVELVKKHYEKMLENIEDEIKSAQ